MIPNPAGQQHIFKCLWLLTRQYYYYYLHLTQLLGKYVILKIEKKLITSQLNIQKIRLAI